MCTQEMGDVAPTSTDSRHDIVFQQQANLARYRSTPLPGPFPPLSRSVSVSVCVSVCVSVFVARRLVPPHRIVPVPAPAKKTLHKIECENPLSDDG